MYLNMFYIPVHVKCSPSYDAYHDQDIFSMQVAYILIVELTYVYIPDHTGTYMYVF